MYKQGDILKVNILGDIHHVMVTDEFVPADRGSELWLCDLADGTLWEADSKVIVIQHIPREKVFKKKFLNKL